MTLRVLLAFVCALAIVSPLAVAGNGLPVMKVLGDFGVRDINDRGQVVGVSGGHACIWEKGVLTDIHDDDFGTYSRAEAINERGQVVGSYELPPGGALDHIRAFIWQDGVMTDLGTLGGGWTEAFDINDRGQVAGFSTNATGGFRGFIWEKGVMTELSPLWKGVYGINNQGQVVEHQWLLEPNGDLVDLGSLGGIGTSSQSINDPGQVVGHSKTATGEWHAFTWEDGVMTDLGTLGGNLSIAEDINARGQVVGTSMTVAGEYHAFIWEDGVMTDLGSLSGCTTSRAVGINDAGQVVGGCNYSAVMWEP